MRLGASWNANSLTSGSSRWTRWWPLSGRASRVPASTARRSSSTEGDCSHETGRMSLEFVNPPELATPRGFSHAVVGNGRVVFLAGQTALDADGAIVGADVVEQFERALGNVLKALAAAGGSPEYLSSMTIYIVDMDDYRAHSRAIGQVWRRLVGNSYPAMAGIGVSRLWDAEALVEVQGYAVLPDWRRVSGPSTQAVAPG